MNQSPLFITECKKRMSSISDWGFRLVQKDSGEDWAVLSWDAHDMNLVQLAQKFGYEFDHEYEAYEVASDRRTH